LRSRRVAEREAWAEPSPSGRRAACPRRLPAARSPLAGSTAAPKMPVREAVSSLPMPEATATGGVARTAQAPRAAPQCLWLGSGSESSPTSTSPFSYARSAGFRFSRTRSVESREPWPSPCRRRRGAGDPPARRSQAPSAGAASGRGGGARAPEARQTGFSRARGEPWVGPKSAESG
jgi:hypothetical protein